MKQIRFAILLIAFVFVVMLWVSTPDERIEVQVSETTAPKTEVIIPQLTEQDILNFFNGYAYADPANRKAVDCVIVTDSAYDLMGVVMYTAEDWEGCQFDFLRKDGICIGNVGIGSVPTEDTALEYLGDGVFTCKLLRTDGSSYLCKIIYTFDEENGTNYKVEEA